MSDAARSSPSTDRQKRGNGAFAVRRIIKANIDRFNALLKIETDPPKRATLVRLIAEQEAKSREVKPDEKKAY